MRVRRLLAGLVLAAGVAAALLRRRARHREHVELYLEDGTTISLTGDSPEASSVVPLARRILAAR